MIPNYPWQEHREVNEDVEHNVSSFVNCVVCHGVESVFLSSCTANEEGISKWTI